MAPGASLAEALSSRGYYGDRRSRNGFASNYTDDCAERAKTLLRSRANRTW